MKTIVSCEYIESGAFQGGEEDCFSADMGSGEPCVAMKRATYRKMSAALRAIKEYVAFGAKTSSDRDLFESKFREIIKR